MRIITLKAGGILLLCVGIINHLVDQLAVTFDGERTVYRFIFALIGYTGFLLIWKL
jgi:hypothetical protein